MQVIGLCGYAGSGKDTAAEALVAEGWQRVSFADPIREMALAIDPIVIVGRYACDQSPAEVRLSDVVKLEGWESAKSHPEVRRLLQRIGTEAGRNILWQDIWVDLARRQINRHESNQQVGIVVTDLRFQNEYDYLRDRKATTIVRISRPGIGPVNDHQSDQHLAGFEVDHEIVNDGDKEKLWASIRAIAKGATR